MNLEKNDKPELKESKKIEGKKDNKYKPDSRNKQSSLKSYNQKFSSTIQTDNSSKYNQTLTTENKTVTKINKNIFPNKKILMKRKKRKQKTIFQPMNMDKFIIYDILFYSFDKNKAIDFNKIREFIINIQRRVNSEYESNNWEISNNNDDNNKIQQLESLVARYSIIVYYLVKKKKIEEAKKILLLMIKENIYYIDYHSHKIFKVFNKLQQKYEILKVYPKMTKELFNIYSFIIKYCILFNFTKYKNMFLIRYLALLSLNYKVFKRKIEMHGFSVETRNQIKYWFALCLHYASYFTINAYCPLKIPISISGLILKLYRNLDENLSTKQEKSILINTSYNQGILYYINNQPDQALKALKLTKQKIMSFHDNDYNDYNNINKLVQIVDSPMINSTTTINNKNNTCQKSSIVQNYFLGLNTKELLFNKKIRNYSFISSNDFVEQVFINEGNRKKNLRMEDISEIFFLNLNLNDNSFIDNLDDNSFIYKKSISPLPSMRGSQSEFDKFLKMKEFNIPRYLKQPLFLNIELLMTEIEIDRKNYNLAYEHIKNCIILILIIKQLGDSSKNNTNKYKRELCVLSEYLEEIEKNNKDKKLLSQIKSLQNLNLSLYQEEKKLKKSTKFINEKNVNHNHLDSEKLKIEKEIEKFFIFLNSLSIYQIKLLNDTQPINDTRNDLPIFFHNQFKDTLSTTQRINLEKLNIMSLSRCVILNNPNNYILPSNLKFISLNKRINQITDIIKRTKNNNNNIIHISFNGSLMNNGNISYLDNNNEDYKDLDDNFIFKNTKEFENFKKIIFSHNSNNDIKLFLLNNFIFAISILKKTEEKDIEEMIEYPEIIIEPIKAFKKKNKNKVKYINENKKDIFNHLMKYPEFKYILNNSKLIKEKREKNYKKKENINQNNSNESIYSISNFIQIEPKINK